MDEAVSIVGVTQSGHGATPALVELRLEGVVDGRIDLSSNGKGMAVARFQEGIADDAEPGIVTEVAVVASKGMLQEARYPAIRRIPIPPPGKLSTEVSETCATFDEAFVDGSGRWLISIPSVRILVPPTTPGRKPQAGP